MWEWINTVLEKNEVMWCILLAVVLIGMVCLWWLHRDSNTRLNLSDIIATNGKINERKLTRFGAWVVSTWGFVYLIIDDKLTEWYFVGYMGAWVANALIGKAIGTAPTKQVNSPNNEEQIT